jgi:hypothetical protein
MASIQLKQAIDSARSHLELLLQMERETAHQTPTGVPTIYPPPSTPVIVTCGTEPT